MWTRTRTAALITFLWLGAALGLSTASAAPAGSTQTWLTHRDPYWGMSFSYPPSWSLQANPYRDFGVRLGSPDLAMDPLGRPVQGMVIAFAAEAANTYEAPAIYSSQEESTLGGLPAMRWTSDDGAGAPVTIWQVLRGDARSAVVVSAASDEAAAAHGEVAAQILNSLHFTGVFQPHPLPTAPASARSVTVFPALKHAFAAGRGWILSGYATWSHQNGDLYALDLCGGYKCSVGDVVLAATDMQLVWSGRGFNMPADSKDFHIWTFGRDDEGNFLCMSLGHLAITRPGLDVGGSVTQGTLIGELVAMPTTPHVHTGIWRSPDHCARWTREPIPYTGTFALDGVDFPAGENHKGKAVISTNVPRCTQSAASAGCQAPEILLTEPLVMTPTQPSPGDLVTVRYTVRNQGNQALAIAQIGVAGHAAACDSWQTCDQRADFPWQPNITLAPGETYTYEANRTFTAEADGYLLRSLVQTGDDRWHTLGDPLTLSVSEPLELVQDLSLTPISPRSGEPVTATFTVMNRSARPLYISRLSVVVRGPDCDGWDCARASDFQGAGNLTLQPGTRYTYTQAQKLNNHGAGYRAVVAEGEADAWRPLAGSQPIEFSVIPAEPTTLRLQGGVVSAHAPITAVLALKSLSPGVAVGTLQGSVTFDSSVVIAETCLTDPDARYEGRLCEIESEAIRFSLTSASGAFGDHPLVQIRFRAKGPEGSSSPLGLQLDTLTDNAGIPIDAILRTDNVTIHRPTAGDVNCSSTLDEEDARFIVQFGMAQRTSAEHCPLPENSLLRPGCDANSDGACTLVDGLFVLQCVAGLGNALCGDDGAPVMPSQPVTAQVGFGVPRIESASVVLPMTATVQTGSLGAFVVAIPFDPVEVASISCSQDSSHSSALAVCHSTATSLHMTLLASAGLVGTIHLADLIVVPQAGAATTLQLVAHIGTAIDSRGRPASVISEPLTLTLPSAVYLPVLTR